MKVVVTSCSKFEDIKPQPVWGEIEALSPDVLILLGDNIYLKSKRNNDPAELKDGLDEGYKELFDDPYFGSLIADMRARQGSILVAYDDHDFAGDNSYGADENTLPLRDIARDALVNAFNITRDNGDEIYSYNEFMDGQVGIALLDVRYHRKSVSQSRGDRNAILGEDQWEWFEKVFRNSNSSYFLIATGTTYFDHGVQNEYWGKYSAASDRMASLIQQREKPGCFIISGDIHENNFKQVQNVIEIVTSGVARDSVVFGKPLKNYGIFEFDGDSMDVALISDKDDENFNFQMPLGRWKLP